MTYTVVYLDDEPDLTELFVDLFSSSEIEIKVFNDPMKAKDYLLSHTPHLVFFDYRLPGITGDKLALELNLKMPTILVTGDMDVSTQFKFTKIFKKPYDINQMREYISLCLQSANNK